MRPQDFRERCLFFDWLRLTGGRLHIAFCLGGGRMCCNRSYSLACRPRPGLGGCNRFQGLGWGLGSRLYGRNCFLNLKGRVGRRLRECKRCSNFRHGLLLGGCNSPDNLRHPRGVGVRSKWRFRLYVGRW